MIIDLWSECRNFIYYLNRKSQQCIIDEMDYDHYWKVRKERPIPARAYVFSRLIEPGSTVLDVGCGDGEIFQYLSQHNNIKAKGIDVSEVAVQKATQKGLDAYVLDITKDPFPFENKFDYVLASEVLEHVFNPEQVLKKLEDRFLKGLIVTIPNIGYYQHRIRMLTGRFPIQWQWHPSEHIRYWTVKDFEQFVIDEGFCVKKIISSNGFPFVERYYPNLHNIWPNLLGEVVVFLLNKTV